MAKRRFAKSRLGGDFGALQLFRFGCLTRSCGIRFVVRDHLAIGIRVLSGDSRDGLAGTVKVPPDGNGRTIDKRDVHDWVGLDIFTVTVITKLKFIILHHQVIL